MLTWTPSKGARVLFHRQGGRLPPSFSHLHPLTMSRCFQNLTQLFSTLYEASRCSGAQSCPTLWPPWAVTRQASVSMECSRQEYWSGLPFPPSGNLPTQGWNPCLLCLLHCRQILYCWVTGEAQGKQTHNHFGDIEWAPYLHMLQEARMCKSSFRSCVCTASCFIVMEKQWGLGNGGSK